MGMDGYGLALYYKPGSTILTVLTDIAGPGFLSEVRSVGFEFTSILRQS